MTEPMSEPVAVKQVDRDAAAAYMDRVQSKRWSIGGILSGGCDNTSIVQAFARHRLAALSPVPASAYQVMREALIECGRAAGAFLSDEVSDEFLKLVPAEVKARIEALTKSSPLQETEEG